VKERFASEVTESAVQGVRFRDTLKVKRGECEFSLQRVASDDAWDLKGQA